MVRPDAAHLTGQDEETQAKRLEFLKGKHLLFISGALNWPSVPGPTKNVLQTVRKAGLIVHMVLHIGNEHNNYCQQVIVMMVLQHRKMRLIVWAENFGRKKMR